MSKFIGFDIDLPQLNEMIINAVQTSVKNEVAKHLTPKTKEILTREETANILGISLTTLHDYTNKGLLMSHRFDNGGRVYYLYEEIMYMLKRND